LFFLIGYFVPNIIVLGAWTGVSPLEWTRTETGSTDIFGRSTGSYASCASDRAMPFLICTLVVNFLALVIGNFWSYQARNIETEYSESSYVGVAMAAVLQAWVMGIPIMIVVQYSPPAKFYVASGIIFVTAMAIFGLVYVPKILALWKIKSDEADHKKQAYATFIKQKQEKDDQFDEDEEDEDNSDNEVATPPSDGKKTATTEGSSGFMSSNSKKAPEKEEQPKEESKGVKVQYHPKKAEGGSAAFEKSAAKKAEAGKPEESSDTGEKDYGYE
jgi:hypothetical protein